jgi:hypothetical protein
VLHPAMPADFAISMPRRGLHRVGALRTEAAQPPDVRITASSA